VSENQFLNEYKFKVIKEKADQVRQRLVGGNLYGAPIDTNNIDQMIVAAYCLGQLEGRPFQVTFTEDADINATIQSAL
jgi:hypothetical protein